MRSSLLVLGLLAWVVPGTEEPLAERRKRLESLTPSQAAEVLDKKKTFDNMPAAERDRIQAMHREITGDPKAAELDHVMREYYSWLVALSSANREELKNLPPNERLAKVKEIIKEQQSRHLPEDVGTALRWLDEFILGHASTITDPLLEDLDKIPEGLRLWVEKSNDAPRRFLLFFVHLRQAQDKSIPSADDFERLYGELTPNGERELRKETSDGARLEKMMRWGFQNMSRMPNQITDEEARYYSEMDPAEKAKLTILSRDQFRRKLREKFMNQQLKSGFNTPLGKNKRTP